MSTRKDQRCCQYPTAAFAALIFILQLCSGTIMVASADGLPQRLESTELELTDKVELLRLLHQQDFTTLEAAFSALQSRFLADRQREFELFHALEAFTSGSDTAETLIEAWIARYPSSFVPYLIAGRHYLARVSNLIGTDGAVSQNDLKLWLKKGVVHFRRAIELHSSLLVAYIYLIRAKQYTAGPEDAQSLLQAGLLIHPGSFLLREAYIHGFVGKENQQQLEQMAKEAQKHVSKQANLPALFAAVATLKAEGAAVEQRFTDTVKLAQKALERAPYWRSHELIGSALIRLEQPKEAVYHLDSSLSLRPQNADSIFLRSKAFAFAGYYEESVNDLLMLDKMEYNSSELPVWKEQAAKIVIEQGLLAFQRNAFSLAAKLFTSALQIQPNSGAAYHNLALSYLKLKEDNLALETLARSIESAPNHFDSYGLKADILALANRKEEAVSTISAYIKVHPTHPQAYLKRAQLRFHLQDRIGAVEDATLACGLGSEEGCARKDWLAESLAAQQKE